MFQLPRPHPTTAMRFRNLRPLRGLLCSLWLVVAIPSTADELPKTVPRSVDVAAGAVNSAPSSIETLGHQLDTSLLQATLKKLAENTRRDVDLILQDRTLRMMDQLRRINDRKLFAAHQVAIRTDVPRDRALALAP